MDLLLHVGGRLRARRTMSVLQDSGHRKKGEQERTYLHERVYVGLDAFHGGELGLALFEERFLFLEQLLALEVQPGRR